MRATSVFFDGPTVRPRVPPAARSPCGRLLTKVGWVLLELPTLAPADAPAEPESLGEASPNTPARAAILSARKKASLKHATGLF